MKKNLYRWMLLCVSGWAAAALAATPANDTPDPATHEHHIYLHVVQPDTGQPVRIIVADQATLPAVADEAVMEKPVKETADDPAEVDEEDDAAAITAPAEDMADTAAEVQEEVLRKAPALVPLEAKPESRADIPLGLLLFIFVLAIFLGFELISKVPSQLHTPLMSGSNAISGITIVGALAAAGLGAGGTVGTLLGTLAVAFATINVVGGYMVTNRMLAMFKKKDGGAQ